jgi:hypothetical protein
MGGGRCFRSAALEARRPGRPPPQFLLDLAAVAGDDCAGLRLLLVLFLRSKGRQSRPVERLVHAEVQEIKAEKGKLAFVDHSADPTFLVEPALERDAQKVSVVVSRREQEITPHRRRRSGDVGAHGEAPTYNAVQRLCAARDGLGHALEHGEQPEGFPPGAALLGERRDISAGAPRPLVRSYPEHRELAEVHHVPILGDVEEPFRRLFAEEEAQRRLSYGSDEGTNGPKSGAKEGATRRRRFPREHREAVLDVESEAGEASVSGEFEGAGDEIDCRGSVDA